MSRRIEVFAGIAGARARWIDERLAGLDLAGPERLDALVATAGALSTVGEARPRLDRARMG